MLRYLLLAPIFAAASAAGAHSLMQQCPGTRTDAEAYIAQVARKQLDDLDPFELLFVKENDLRMMERLGRAFDINSCGGPFDSSFLGTAATLGSEGDVVRALEHGANLERPLSSRGESALIQALFNNRFDVAKHLIAVGADIRSTYGDSYRYSALDAMSMAMKDPKLDARKQLELAEYLLQNGLSPNRKDLNPKLGLTPLIKAVIYDKPVLVKVFKKYGGDPRLISNSGKSAIDYARSMNRIEILQMLEAN